MYVTEALCYCALGLVQAFFQNSSVRAMGGELQKNLGEVRIKAKSNAAHRTQGAEELFLND